MDIPLDEVVYFDGISSSSTGAAADADSTPTFAVYEEATDTDIGVGGNMTKRTSLTGNYRGSFTLSAANGFELGKWYNVIGSATIGGVGCKGRLFGPFRVIAAELVAGYPPTDALKAGGVTWGSGAITSGVFAAGAITAAAVADGAIDAATFASGALDAVWSTTTRLLTAGTNIVLAKNTGITGFNDITAADVWAVGTRALTDKAGFTISGTFTTLDALATHGDLAWATATGFAVAGDAMALTASERNSTADAILTRDVSSVEGVANDHSLCYVVLASSEWSVSGTTLTVKKTDGTTTFTTKTLTKTAGDSPVRGAN